MQPDPYFLVGDQAKLPFHSGENKTNLKNELRLERCVSLYIIRGLSHYVVFVPCRCMTQL